MFPTKQSKKHLPFAIGYIHIQNKEEEQKDYQYII